MCFCSAVRLENDPREFAVGVVRSHSLGDAVCAVEFRHATGGSVLMCSLDAVMELSTTLPGNSSGEQLPAVPSVVRGQSQPPPVPSVPSVLQCAQKSPMLTIAQRRQAKVSAMLAVRDLLHRKEQLVNALARMNSQAAGDTAGVGGFSSDSSALSATATQAAGSSAANAWADRSILQRQYAWVVMNLDATNQSLQEALVRLQACSRDVQVRFLGTRVCQLGDSDSDLVIRSPAFSQRLRACWKLRTACPPSRLSRRPRRRRTQMCPPAATRR